MLRTPAELELPLATRAARRAARACGATRRCSSSCCSRRSARAWRSARPGPLRSALAPLQSWQCADGSARRPFPSTVTRCRSCEWTGRWSRSRTTSPSSCASTTARRGTTRSCAERRSGGCCWAACPCSCSAASTSAAGATPGQRDYEAVVRAVVADRAADRRGDRGVPSAHAIRALVGGARANATVAVVLPNGVIVLFALLALVFLVGVRALARTHLRAPPAGRLPRRRARASARC